MKLLSQKFICFIFVGIISLTYSYKVNLNSLHKSENSNQDNIFVSEKILKHKKNLKTKQIKTAVSPTAKMDSTTTNDSVSSDSDLGQNTNLFDLAGKSKTGPSDADVGKGPIFFEGWVKYFKFSDVEILGTTPKHFYRNNDYFEQFKGNHIVNVNEKSEGMYTNIKSETFFFAMLFSQTLNFVTSRDIKIQKTYDSLNIDWIAPVMESQEMTGGISDFGNFSEGYCSKIVSNKPRVTSWVVCTESETEKNKFITSLKKLKIKRQRDQGIFPTTQQKPKQETLSDILNSDKKPKEGATQNLKKDQGDNLGVVFDANKDKITDGYWIVLQEWTQCSLKCGGGTSFLQRMCVPPKSGGKDCQGDKVLTKSCNTQPCPDILKTEYKTKNDTITLKPIVKVMPFSSRPQRYTKCVIKESDLMMVQKSENDLNNQNNNPLISNPTNLRLQVPTRVVMNNRTVSIFSGEEYNTLVTVFNLAETEFKRSLTDKSCFILTDSKQKQAELCPFGCNSVSKAIEEWDYDFHLFKYQCNTPRDVIDVDEAELQSKLKEKIQQAKKEILEEREKEIKRKLEEKEQTQLDGVVKTTNQVALQAIQKELSLEEMIKQEETQREAQEEKQIQLSIEKEKQKAECIVRAIKERKLENQYNLRTKQAEEEIKNIKTTTTEEVLIRRSQLKDLILKMRQNSKKRQQKLQSELHDVRLGVAKEMGDAYKKGEATRCLESAKDKEKRLTYCTANFSDDYNNLQNCKESEDFSTLCCDLEFGDFFANERLQCYELVNSVGKKTDSKGRWIWQQGII